VNEEEYEEEDEEDEDIFPKQSAEQMK